MTSQPWAMEMALNLTLHITHYGQNQVNPYLVVILVYGQVIKIFLNIQKVETIFDVSVQNRKTTNFCRKFLAEIISTFFPSRVLSFTYVHDKPPQRNFLKKMTKENEFLLSTKTVLHLLKLFSFLILSSTKLVLFIEMFSTLILKHRNTS